MESWDEYEDYREDKLRRHRRNLIAVLFLIGIINPIIVVFTTPDRWWMAFLLPVSMMSFLVVDFGNPLRWWHLFTGIEIRVDLDKISREESVHGFDSMRPKIQEWLEETTPKYQYIMINPYRYKFLRKRHAAMFKLAWG